MLDGKLPCAGGAKNRARYGWVVVLAAIFFGLVAGSFWAPRPALAAGGKAYIVLGDLEPAWYSNAIRSIFGEVNIRRELNPVIQSHARHMQGLGYEVEFIEIALTSDIERIIKDPATKAIAWFGHGDKGTPGVMGAYDGDITSGDIKEWAQKKLAEKIGYPSTWNSLSEAERRNNIELWNNAHFDLEYAYFHSCYSLRTNDMPNALMADDGMFYGYKDLAYLTDTSIFTSKIRDEEIGLPFPEVLDNMQGIGDWDGTEIDWSQEIEKTMNETLQMPPVETPENSGEFKIDDDIISSMFEGYLEANIAAWHAWWDSRPIEEPLKEIEVFIKGKRINFDVPPLIENGRTLVPIRKIADALGCTTEWYPPDTVIVDAYDTFIYLQINNRIACVNGEDYVLDVPPQIVGNRTLLPLRFLSESLGLQVDWDDNTRVITIN